MKKKGKSGTAGEGWLEQLLGGTWRQTSWGGRLRAGGAKEGEDGKMKGGGERKRSGLWPRPRPGWVEAERAMATFLPPSSQFHFHGLLKISQVAISFSLPTPPRHFVLRRPCALPSPVTIVMSP